MAIDIRLVIALRGDGTYQVGCRDTEGRQHMGNAANWPAACAIAAHVASELAAELSEAGAALPRVNGVIRP